MSHNLTSRAANLIVVALLLISTTACSDMGDSFDSTYNDVFGSDTPSPKVGVRSAAAAPYQDVKEAEMAQQTAPQTNPVELGGMTDKTLEITDGTNAPAPIAKITPEPSTPVAAPTQVADAGTLSLLTVRFNQPHVYYDDALAKAVSEAEKAKSDVNYDVLSSMPNLSSLTAEQQEKLSKRGEANLRNVVLKMQQMGVPPERIRVANQTLTLRSQEIQIFVR